jgi:NAD(P) transhydrogenase subunit alpha
MHEEGLMAVRIGVPRETAAGETRVALVPAVAEKYAALGAEVLLERRAGQLSHIRDEEYTAVKLVDSAAEVFAADVILKVDPPTPAEVGQMGEGAVVLGLLQPYKADDSIKALRDRRITSFSLELLPRITRAQSMDALTSQASIAGYKAVLMSACLAGRYYPMLTTPAGTLRPAKVLVLGVGVAGLQAIATARRLGAVVEAYDVRSVTREQVQSLGGRFIDTGIDAEIEGGYARELTDEEKAKAKEIVDGHIVEADAVITTAAIPGRPSPKLITADVVDRMKPGAVIIDMAAEGGGNCELTRPGEQYNHPNGVFVYGPLNIPGMLPVHASDQYARNLMHFLTPFIKDGELVLDWDDEVLAGSVLTRDGAIVNQQARERIEGPGAPAPAEPAGGGTQSEPPEDAPGEGPGHTDVPGEGEPAHDAPEPPDDALTDAPEARDEEGGAR